MPNRKILIYSEYYDHKTGYSRNLKDMLPYLKKGNEVAHVALGWNGYPLDHSMKVYHTKGEDVKDYYAAEVLQYAIDDFKPDIVLTVQDYWMLHKVAFVLAHPYKLKWFHWGTLDGDPLPHQAREAARWVHFHLYYSNFARIEMLSVLPQVFGDVLYPPVNPKVFHELDKEELRKKFHLDNHKTIVCCARNQIRKNLPVLFDAMKIVVQEIPNAALILASSIHAKTDTGESAGYDLDRYVSERGLGDHVIIPQTVDRTPIDDETLNVQYNLADINILPSVGEGFGLPYIESGISGIPSVAVDCAASTEIVRDRGILVKPAAYTYNQGGSKYYMVKPQDLAESIIKLLTNDKLRKKMGRNAKKFAKTLTPKSRAEKMLKLFERSIKEDWQPLARR